MFAPPSHEHECMMALELGNTCHAYYALACVFVLLLSSGHAELPLHSPPGRSALAAWSCIHLMICVAVCLPMCAPVTICVAGRSPMFCPATICGLPTPRPAMVCVAGCEACSDAICSNRCPFVRSDPWRLRVPSCDSAALCSMYVSLFETFCARVSSLQTMDVSIYSCSFDV